MSLARRLVRRARPLFLVAVAASVGGCIHIFHKLDVVEVPRPAGGDSTFISSPLKAHLADGGASVFRQGAWVNAAAIWGAGQRFTATGAPSFTPARVTWDSVVGVETFAGEVLSGTSIVVSVAATALALGTAPYLLVAIFGSCPTIYADTGSGPVLQAEGFSYAIAPLFEHRDVDPLRTRPGPDGAVHLELRNEALETHYINHVGLLAVRHAKGERVVPDQHGRIVAVRGPARIRHATDRAGRDALPALGVPDGDLYTTAPSTVANAREGDLEDWIDLDVTDLPPGDSIAVVLRLRNSLLNTILLYEGMLGGRDAPDWLANGLQHISSAVELGRWYSSTMGMRASVDGVAGGFASRTPLARMGDVGPIAFRDVAFILPRAAVDTAHARIRLRFVADRTTGASTM